MGYKLVIYSSKAFREYVLPTVQNADYALYLSENVLGQGLSAKICLENVEGAWRFVASDDYKITQNGTDIDYVGKTLRDQDLVVVSLQHIGNPISIQFRETLSNFQSYKKYILEGISELSIGRNTENDISFSGSNLIERQQHAVLKKTGEYWILENHGKNGIFINGIGTVQGKQLEFGDKIDLFGLSIVFLKDIIAVNAKLDGVNVSANRLKEISGSMAGTGQFSGQRKEKVIFHRSPRQIYHIDTESIEIEAPPQPKQENKKPVLMTIGPSLTMAIPMMLGGAMSILGSRSSSGSFMYTGLITAFSSAIIGATWAIANLRYEKKRLKEEELHRFEAYGEYLIKCSNKIKETYEKNAQYLREMYPEAAVCCSYNEQNITLWNRNSTHEDYLTYRLGMGDIPFQAEIIVPKERFTMINDSLSEKPRMIKQSYEILRDVPVSVNLAEHTLIGVVGGKNKKGAKEVLYNLVAQIATANSYTDVKMIFLYDEKDANEGFYSFAKWLPHVWSEDKKTRFVAGNKSEASDVLYELTKILRIRMENAEGSRNEKTIPKPYYILFVANPALLEGELISSYVYRDSTKCGLSTVMLVEGYEDLPNACDYIIEKDDNYQGMYSVSDNFEERIAVRFDELTVGQLEWLAKNLSNIEVNETEASGDMPNSLTFFEMYGINRLDEFHVMDRWRKNRTYESMKALVGQKSGGVDCYLDVHEKYHGPHGLVAGTTGSGKSETLQTYLLSLALNFSPDDVGFFLIDYKGGGMANLFDGLPHVIGQISNLSGNQVRRAMVSIKSENKRRQRIFNEHDVNNINLYTRLYKNHEASIPIPHLFIVIDEFAEMKREEPEFMKELISVAQVGRSLGVHLILATQKPSGTVDDNIWSNSKFRLCLRVQDRQDSNDMLHRPDAAYITQAGRCYLQVGNDELFELFQSGYSGAAYDEEAGEAKTDIAFMMSTTGKAALVGNHLKKERKEQAKNRWIEQLLSVLEQVISTDAEDGMLVVSDTADIINRFFDALQKEGVDYPYSEYNVKRVQNLLQIYGEIEEKTSQNILEYAESHKLKLPEMKEKTQLDAVVEYLHRVAEENGYQKPAQLWLPVLPTTMYLQELDGYQKNYNGTDWGEDGNKAWTLSTPIGMYDDPVNQAQNALVLDFAENGHHVITGIAGSGKSTFLQSLLYAFTCKYSPKELSVYALDFSAKMLSAFRKMPHVGGVVYDDELEKLDKFFTMITAMIEERKKKFQGGNFGQYVRVHGMELPAVIVAIDNYANFRGKTEQKYDDLILQLVKEGTGCGIFLVITAGGFSSSELPNKVADNIRTTIALEMSDKFQYSEIMRMTHLEVLPEVNIKGRGLAKVGDDILEFHTALAFEAEDDFKRMEMIEELAESMAANWKGKRARHIPEIPEKPVWEEFSSMEEFGAMEETDYFLPVGYDAVNASVYGMDLSQIYCYLIMGKARTGKTNFLKLAAASALQKQGRVVLFDFNGELKVFAEKNEIECITTDEEMFNFFKALMPIFIERNKYKKEIVAQGLMDEEIYEAMLKYERYFLMIGNLSEFVMHVTRPAEGVGAMAPFVENLLDKGALHNVFWMACHTQEESLSLAGKKTYELFIKDKKGVHFGGNVAAQRLLDFSDIPYMEQNRTYKSGIALIKSTDETDKVVIPLYK